MSFFKRDYLSDFVFPRTCRPEDCLFNCLDSDHIPLRDVRYARRIRDIEIRIAASVGEAFLRESRQSLQGSLAKIAHCVDQLSDDDVWWRPFEAANSIANLLLHLSGNVRQWIGDALLGRPDLRSERRNSPSEGRFSKVSC